MNLRSLKRFSIVVFVALSVMFLAEAMGADGIPKIASREGEKLSDKREKLFVDPPKEFRPVPMWAWAGDIDDAEIDRQLELMLKQKIYEPMVYPRYGLTTPYLSEEWFARVRHTVERAVELGMNVWLYDEYCWPSGTAKGKVTENPAFRMTYLKCLRQSIAAGSRKRDIGPETVEGDVLRAVAYSLSSHRTIDLSSHIQQGKLSWQAPQGDWEIAAFTVGAPQSYVDTMNPAAIASFIAYTHQSYYENLGPDLWKHVKGMFTDEPVFSHERKGNSFPWTPDLPEKFAQLKGYDLIPKLHELALDAGDYVKVRHDFWEVATTMYAEAFHRQIGQWCAEHGISYTGHLLAEQPLSALLRHEGDFFLNEREFQVPGMDEIGTNPTLGSGSQFIAAKMTQSTADYIKAKRTFCEVYALGPCSMTLEKMRRMVNFTGVLGVNTYLLAVCPYSMEGNTVQKGYFSTVFYQQPWFDSYFHIYSDYVGRVTYMLTQGTHAVEVGVMFPTGGYWVRDTFDMSGRYSTAVEKGLEQVSRTLLQAHIDYDYIFDQCFEDAEVSNGTMKVRDQNYSTIILPPVKYLDAGIMSKLREFVESGGRLIGYGILPESDLEGKDISPVVSSIFGVDSAEHSEKMLDTAIEENRWVSAGSDEPHWLVVDFGTEKTFDRIKLFFSMTLEGTGKLSLADYRLQYYRDGEWVDIISVEGNREFEPSYDFAPTTSRKVRLFVTKPGRGDKVARLREIEVYESSGSKANIALASSGSTATCSSTYYQNSTADKAINGDKRTREPVSESVEIHRSNQGRGEAIFLARTAQDAAGESLDKALVAVMENPDVVIDDPEGNILYQHRRTEAEDIYFLINMLTEKKDDVAISLKADGVPRIWDADDGSISDVEYSLCDGRIQMRLSFEAGQALFVVVDKGAEPKAHKETAPEPEEILVLDGEWGFELDRANSLRVKGWRKEPDGVWEADFAMDFVPEKVSIYYPESFASLLSMNGKPFDRKPVKSYYMDESYLEVEAGHLLKIGDNAIRIKSTLEAESKYLPMAFVLGDFSVKDGKICAPTDRCNTGDWVTQGYPEYAGTGIYRKSFVLAGEDMDGQRLYVDLDTKQNIAELWVNGNCVGTRAWEPYRMEITGYVRSGENRIEVKVTNSLFNRLLDDPQPAGLFSASILRVQAD